MRAAPHRRRFAFALAALAAGALAAACAPAETGDADPSEEPESDLLARESGFGADPDYVVRDRVVFAEEAADVVRFEAQPFSHRAKRWHVYPMNVYPGAKVAVRLLSEDRKLAHVGEVRLYGPAFSDGSFPTARTVTMNEAGIAELKEATLEAGRYALVVGPRDRASFARRYPGNVVVAKLPGGAEPTVLTLSPSGDGFTATAGGKAYRVISPTPDQVARQDGANAGGTLRLKAPGDGFAAEIDAKIVRWEIREFYTRSDDDGSGRSLGALDGEVLTLWDGAEGRRHLVQASARIGKSEPFLLTVVPEVVPKLSEAPAAYKGKALQMATLPECVGEGCRVPVVANAEAKSCSPVDASSCGTGQKCFAGKCLAPLPADVVAKVATSHKPLFVGPEETSTYSLEVTCKENCAPTPIDRNRMTKYPVYFAHGFNSSSAAWDGIRAHLARVPGFTDRSQAASVPAFEPLAVRADRLRQRMGTFIEYMRDAAPIAGEPMRVNVIAHSMGGLDTRTLIALPRFNEECERATCEDVDDKTGTKTKTNCCAPKEGGKPTFWRDRIVSVTTLSTPHRGSSFASWAMGQLSDESSLTPTLKAVASRFFGLEAGGFEAFREAIDALSAERGEEREKLLALPNAARSYTWACATKEDRCVAPPGIDGPRTEGGQTLLPAPNDKPTVFSWAAISCATGGCGSVLDPALLLPYAVMSGTGEKKNDGVVGVERARFGIFMGVMAADHFDWTRTSTGRGTGKQALEWLFGMKSEPIERFHQTWLERLAKAGY